MEAVFEKIYSVCTELCKMQEFCLFTENVCKISNCTDNNCESEKFMKELSKNVFNEEFSYDERRKFFKKNKTEKELEKFTNLQKCFDSFLKIMSFYQTEICDHEACSQCFL